MVLKLNGFRIGHFDNETALTGCTVLLFDKPALAAADVRGSAPATANFSTLDPLTRSARIDAILLTGGSSFGLSAVSGVQRYLENEGKGFDVGVTHVPNVPCAAIFDIAIGDKTVRPDAEMAEMACKLAVNVCDRDGSIGAGMGASVGKLFGLKQAMRGGFGFASDTTIGGAQVWAFAVVNAFGDVWNLGRSEIIAGARTAAEESTFADSGKLMREGVRRTGFGGSGKAIEPPDSVREEQDAAAVKLIHDGQTADQTDGTSNTTLVVVVTDAALTPVLAKKMAQGCMTGLTDVVYPACTVFDGDLVIAVSIGDIQEDLTHLCLVGQSLVSEAIVGGVKAARPAPGLPAYEEEPWYADG
jgi:L-aminopeptidase/D-esterase-like protein